MFVLETLHELDNWQDRVCDYIICKNKKIVSYFSYDVGKAGETIFETRNGDKDLDAHMVNFIVTMLHLGATLVGQRYDNKIAVKVQVEGLDFPVYLSQYDGRFAITTDINIRGGSEYKTHFKIDLNLLDGCSTIKGMK